MLNVNLMFDYIQFKESHFVIKVVERSGLGMKDFVRILLQLTRCDICRPQFCYLFKGIS